MKVSLFTHLFMILTDFEKMANWERFRYITLMVVSKEYYIKHQCFADHHISKKLPFGIRSLLGGEIQESTFEFNAKDGESFTECVGRCVQLLTEARVLYIGNDCGIPQEPSGEE